MRQNKTPRKVRIEYGSYFSEAMDEMLLVRSVGYGKPSTVYQNVSDYFKSRPDLELIMGYENEKNPMLKETAKDSAGFIGNKEYFVNAITYKLVICHDYYLPKDKDVRELLSYYRECMDARRDRRGA